MSSIRGPMDTLAAGLVGLTSDTGKVIQRQFTSTPDQPQPADFPAMIIEFSPDEEGYWRTEAIGLARHDYALQVMILVGVYASGTGMADLHNEAIAWSMPLAAKLATMLTLGGVDSVQWIGDGQNVLMSYRIQPIIWNQIQFFGLRARIGVTEKPPMTMG